jgi:hypothetical protein
MVTHGYFVSGPWRDLPVLDPLGGCRNRALWCAGVQNGLHVGTSNVVAVPLLVKGPVENARLSTVHGD